MNLTFYQPVTGPQVLGKLPNLTKKFELLKIVLDLPKYVNPNTITGLAILKAIESKKYSNEELIAYLKDQARDSPHTMNKCIWEEMTRRVLNF